MIYKFRDQQGVYDMEVELFNEENQSSDLDDNIEISLIKNGKEATITLSKKEVYRLIGALHYLHKDTANFLYLNPYHATFQKCGEWMVNPNV